jgi:serine/threonine protein kinase
LRIGSITHLRLSGAIDETFSPQALAADNVGHVLLDLGQLERISSFGVRKWIDFVSKVPTGALSLTIIHAPPIVVDQLNLVEGFAGVSKVLSLLAPYRCNTCNEDRLRLVDVIEQAEVIAAGQAPDHNCPVCESKLEFADMPAEFFDFVRVQGLQEVDGAISRYVRSLLPVEVVESGNMVKLVQDDITYFRMSGPIKSDLNVRRLSSGLEGRVVFDFGGVNAVEPGGAPKLSDVIERAVASAKVTLWKVPPQVLLALSKLGKPVSAKIGTLWLPAECRNCGNKVPQRVSALTYVQELEEDRLVPRPCSVCGGEARLPALKDCYPILRASAGEDEPSEAFETIETRAFSQYIAGSSPEHTPTRGGTDTQNRVGQPLQLQVLRRLGQGGMAEVFLARQVGVKGFEKYVVVKKILPQFAESPEFVEMLFAEARANARLTHPNIVQTYDVGMMDGVAYITMEYVRGPDAKKLIVELRKKGVALPMEHALRIVAETAAGLHYAHSYVDPTGKPHPMVHRDVSPHNILISLDGAIKLSDFGIAKVQGESENTQAGVLKGKIAYISPEAVGGMQLDGRNDVFALGVVLFELLTGKLPFKRENDAATLRAIVREPAPNPSELNPAIPQEISAIVLRALEKDPAWRIQSAALLREELEIAMAKAGMSSSPFTVARFFQEQLGERLAAYSAPGQSGSLPAVAPVATPPRRSDTPVVPISVDVGDAPPRPASGPRPSANAPQRPNTPTSPAFAASRGSGTQPAVSPPPNVSDGNSTAVLTPRPDVGIRRPDPRPEPSQHAPRPEPVRSEPPRREPAHHEAPRHEASRHEASRHEPAPRPLERRPSDVPAAPPPAKVASPVRWIAAVVGVLAIGGAAAVLGLRGGSGTEVLHLGADEKLYVSGVQVDSQALDLHGKLAAVIATAKNGKILRVGNVTSESVLDVGALLDAPSDPTAQQATLTVESEPSGCPVVIGGAPAASGTPVGQAIEAGKEMYVTVNCPNLPVWGRWVMGLGGQSITLKASVSK